ncbi:NCS2 family permease [Francisellaceae bacterium CB299]|jgi:AGZA family xanthine/uracil permease-like MFS transporter
MLLKILENKNSQSFSLKTEVIAGATTFLAMMYIIIVNPVILAQAGIPYSAAVTTTVITSVVCCVIMGVFSNSPIALAPGMGLNAFFTYSIVESLGVSWQVALGIVFWSGLIFTLLCLVNLRKLIIEAIPHQIRYAMVCGIGLLIAVVGLKSANIVAVSATGFDVMPLNLSSLLFLVGLVFVCVMIYYNVTAALIISIVFISVLYFLVCILFPSLGSSFNYHGILASPDFSSFFQLDLKHSFTLALFPAIFAFLFSTMFDGLSGVLGISEAGDMYDENGDPKNFSEILTVNGIASIVSGLFGTSPAIGYIESVAGVKEGGRTGVTAIVAGILFIPFLFLSPLLVLVPGFATAPVLLVIAMYMVSAITKIQWQDIEESVPCLLVILIIPLTNSITHGIIFGLLIWTLIRLCTGRVKDVSITLIIINLLSIFLLVSEM